MNRTITISREFGSGGRELGRRLAEQLRIAYYDQEIITEIAKRTSFSEQYVQEIMQQRPIISMPIHVGRSFCPLPNPCMKQSVTVHRERILILQELAEKSDCVIVGQCADCFLKNPVPFRIFVYASMESKMKRCREREAEGERMSDKELMCHISEIDKRRAQSYSFYTDKKWGNKLNYDLCINTTKTNIKEIVNSIVNLF